MFKKLTLLALSVAALVAFAIPATASATGPLITNSEGGAAKTISALSTNTKSTTPNGTLECTTVSLHGNLSENANTTAKGSGTGTAVGNPKPPATHTGTCISSSGLLVHVTSVTLSEIHATVHKEKVGEEEKDVTTGTAKFSYTYDLYNGSTFVAHCTFNGEATVKKTGTSSLNISGTLTRVAPSGFLCPASGTIHGDFTVTDEAGNPAHID